MLYADLYEDRVSVDSYVTGEDCRSCGFGTRAEFLSKLKSGELSGRSCRMDRQRFLALTWAARPGEILPRVEVLQLPSPGPAGLFPLNGPGPDSPVLVSGNSTLTVEVLSSVLARTVSPFWYLVVDTLGHTVDMALVHRVLTADRIHQAFVRAELPRLAARASIMLPGLAAPLCEDLWQRICCPVEAGPICAAELPLFLGPDRWGLPGEGG
ncbi:MAG: hypothetical protein AB1640_01905 [bacterium]